MRFQPVRRLAIGKCLGFLAINLAVGWMVQASQAWADEENSHLVGAATALEHKLGELRSAVGTSSNPQSLDFWADADVFRKGVAWALRYETKLDLKDTNLINKALERGNQRAKLLAAGEHAWARKTGRVVRGFVSAVDGSTQPYGLVLPAGYDPTRPIRLDVVLHGSTRPTGLSELRFMDRFDEGDEPLERPTAPGSDQNFVELHPLGRVENGYRWAGETDVFEAIEATCRHYSIDRDRLVLRGMSMGASGTWHLGLKNPDVFVALGPYCGYVDTHQFSETPLPNFIKVGPLPPYQEKMLHLLDSQDYAANAGVVPAIAAIGDKDVFFQAHEIMGRAMEREGLKMVNLISPGTAHVIDPVTHAEQMRRIGEYATHGLDRAPHHIRFVTWTLKYSRCHWIQVLGLESHYTRTELEARVAADGTVEVAEPKNITRFAILPPMLQGPTPRLRVSGAEVALSPSKNSGRPRTIIVARQDGKWAHWGDLNSVALPGKRPGLQGPIDDAFTKPFLCVRGTGQAWSPTIAAWSEANLKRFAYEWRRYFRGELPIKDDTAVTDADLRRANLILFGDPGSNIWIKRALPNLPIEWTRNDLHVSGAHYPSADHAPLLISSSPFPGAEGHYLVLNSGHTFHEKELASLNYLLFPRLGDWAVMKVGVGDKASESPAEAVDESLVETGFFDD